MISRKARLHARRWRAGLAALVPVGALLGAFVMTGPASAAVATPSDLTSVSGSTGSPLSPLLSYVFWNKGYNSMCMDLRDNIDANYQPVQLYTCNNTSAQGWQFAEAGSTIRLASNSNMCLDIYAGGTWNGDTVDLYQCNNTGAQVWIPEPGGALYNPQSNKCLDDPNWSTTPATQLQIWDCHGGANQNWHFQYLG